MGLSNELSCEAGSLSSCRPNPQGCFHSGLRLYFPALEPWVVPSASLPAIRPRLSVRECGAAGCYPLLCPPCSRHSESGPLSLSARMWGRRVCQWSDCLPRSSYTPPVSVPPRHHESSSPRLPISTPPTSLHERSFFYFLGVGLPCPCLLYTSDAADDPRVV